ncbi:hypothetical protein V6N12_050230 [Hibiscus sabdariffa]|uniref:RNase H type-1 domain-containing protein n=1 Tax=Hibiscus sabdariffa TaxID=183260 RepID=A0ABR2GCD1_9ROSI
MLVRAIASFIQRPWFVDFTLIRREVNCAADHLCKLPSKDDGSIQAFHDPSSSLLTILHEDLPDPTNRYC